MTSNGLRFAEDVHLGEFEISGWKVIVLADRWPNGRPRPIAFLDRECLVRLIDQGLALLKPKP